MGGLSNFLCVAGELLEGIDYHSIGYPLVINMAMENPPVHTHILKSAYDLSRDVVKFGPKMDPQIFWFHQRK